MANENVTVFLRANTSALCYSLACTLPYLKGSDKRRHENKNISKALALSMISIGVTWLAIFVLLVSEKHAQMIDVVFEAVSALGTVGLSRGLTGSLSNTGEGIIIFLMFIGRLGPLTLTYFLASPRSKKVRYPKVKMTVG